MAISAEESVLKGKKIAELREIAAALRIPDYQALRKAELREAILKFAQTNSSQEEPSAETEQISETESKGESIEPTEPEVLSEQKAAEPLFGEGSLQLPKREKRIRKKKKKRRFLRKKNICPRKSGRR